MPAQSERAGVVRPPRGAAADGDARSGALFTRCDLCHTSRSVSAAMLPGAAERMVRLRATGSSTEKFQAKTRWVPHAMRDRLGPQKAAFGMQDSSEFLLRPMVSDRSNPDATGPLFSVLAGGDAAALRGSEQAVRGLLLLVEVADTVTEQLSLDHQLPRLIELIAAALRRRARDPFSPRSGNRRAVLARCPGRRHYRNPHSGHRRHCRRGVRLGRRPRSSPTPIRTCASTRRSTAGPAISRATSSACRCATAHGQMIGVTQVLNKRAGDASPRPTPSLLEAINRQAANAIEQARLVEQLERARREEERAAGDHRGDLDRAAARRAACPHHARHDRAPRRRTRDAVHL